MISSPHNDHQCLGPITEQIIDMVLAREPSLVELAERFDSTEDLAASIRLLPQRDDLGDPNERPKIYACRPPQRFRIDTPAPNCVERTGRFVGAAEMIDPDAVYRLATVNTRNGLHTFPTSDGEPVILDPLQTRNALRAGLYRDGRNGSEGPVLLTPNQAIDWIADLALEPAARFAAGPQRVHNGHRALRGVLIGRPICIADIKDVAFVLALGDREAREFGPTGSRIVHTTARAIDQLDRMAADRALAEQAEGDHARNAGPFSIRIGDTTISPNIPFLGSLARVGGRIAGNVGMEALKVKLATLGLSPPVLTTVERELNREGLSLGPFASPPPMLGSLEAMTPEALAGRWLASKF